MKQLGYVALGLCAAAPVFAQTPLPQRPGLWVSAPEEPAAGGAEAATPQSQTGTGTTLTWRPITPGVGQDADTALNLETPPPPPLPMRPVARPEDLGVGPALADKVAAAPLTPEPVPAPAPPVRSGGPVLPANDAPEIAVAQDPATPVPPVPASPVASTEPAPIVDQPTASDLAAIAVSPSIEPPTDVPLAEVAPAAPVAEPPFQAPVVAGVVWPPARGLAPLDRPETAPRPRPEEAPWVQAVATELADPIPAKSAQDPTQMLAETPRVPLAGPGTLAMPAAAASVGDILPVARLARPVLPPDAARLFAVDVPRVASQSRRDDRSPAWDVAQMQPIAAPVAARARVVASAQSRIAAPEAPAVADGPDVAVPGPVSGQPRPAPQPVPDAARERALPGDLTQTAPTWVPQPRPDALPAPTGEPMAAVVFGAPLSALPGLSQPEAMRDQMPVRAPLDPNRPLERPMPDADALERLIAEAAICWRAAWLSYDAQWTRVSVDVAFDAGNRAAAPSIQLTGFAHGLSSAAEEAYQAAHAALVGCGEASEDEPITHTVTLNFDHTGVHLR